MTTLSPDLQTHSDLAPQFEDLEQQFEATQLGVWVFLATEILFFGALFTAYTVYRSTYPAAFGQMSNQTSLLFGTLNTAVLLTSSYFMALAVESAKGNRRQALLRNLALTFSLGVLFLFFKGLEYREDIQNHWIPGSTFPHSGPQAGPEQIFWFLYYVMTSIHAVHLTIGVSLIAWIIFKGSPRASGREDSALKAYERAHLVGLYWHFVDAIWVFLYPLLYLIDRGHR